MIELFVIYGCPLLVAGLFVGVIAGLDEIHP